MAGITELLGLTVRWAHLTTSILLVGSAAVLLLAGPSDRPTARRWDVRVAAAARWLVLLALATALASVAYQTAVLEDRATAALEPAALARFLLETRGGTVWLLRGSLLVLLGVFVALPADIRRRADWRAARGQALFLALGALMLVAAAGHAAAVDPGTAIAVAADAAHLLAAGLWIGALPALALLLVVTARPDGADARPYAVRLARRFSRVALGLVAALALSGVVSASAQIGSVAGLLGTPHGRLLLLKLGIFATMLAVAVLNRRLLPALGGEAATVGRPAMRRLSRLVTVEAGLALLALVIVALMIVTPPARHEQPTWPLAFRLSLEALTFSPDARARTLVGSQVTVLGLVAVLASWPVRRLRLPLAAGGLVVALAGGAIALPPLAVDAYPTTYRRPEVAYHASSIAEGARLYADGCAVCHGPEGGGDGPAAAGLHPRPPDLRAHHANLHTAGDFFWWITTGLGPMPAFGDRLAPEERWHVINFVRALAAADSARLLGPVVDRDRPWLVAPDFAFAVGPTAARALKDYRGQRIVLVVLYTLPASRTRLAELAQHYGTLSTLGVEVIAVPTDAAPDALHRLGDEPPWILFPVVTEGAREIVRTYRLLSPAPHAEFLVDRQGYLRAITGALGDASRQINLLLAEVQTLNEERPAPPPDEHVH